MSSITSAIRNATLTDLPAIKHCAQAAYEPYIRRIGKKPAPMIADFEQHVLSEQIIVAVEDANIIGYVVYFPIEQSMRLENVAVLPAYSGRGIGRALIGHVESVAGQSGLSTIELYTNALMSENLRLYPKLGYREVDRRTEDGFDRVYFSKAV